MVSENITSSVRHFNGTGQVDAVDEVGGRDI